MYALPLLLFLVNNFSYGPYLCGGCYEIMQKSNNFKNIAIVHVIAIVPIKQSKRLLGK